MNTENREDDGKQTAGVGVSVGGLCSIAHDGCWVNLGALAAGTARRVRMV